MSSTRDANLGLPIALVEGDVVDPQVALNRPNLYSYWLADVFLADIFGSGFVVRDPAAPAFDAATGRVDVPAVDNPIFGLVDGKPFRMTSSYEVDGTADSGTTTTLVDTALSQAEDFWMGAWVVFTSGTNNGLARQVTGFDAATGTLSWSSAVTAAVAAADTYTVTFYYISGKTVSNLNYVYARAFGAYGATQSYITTEKGIVEWFANITGVKPDGAILVGTLTLDAGGAVTASDLSPTGHDHTLYQGGGGIAEVVITGSVTGIAGGATTAELTRTHDPLILFGPVTITCSQADCIGEITHAWEGDEVRFTITNSSAYSRDTDYTITRKGRGENT